MKRAEILTQLEDLKYSCKNFESFESKETDVQALEYAIKEIKKGDSEKCDCCEDKNYVLIVDSVKLCKGCLNRLKEINL